MSLKEYTVQNLYIGAAVLGCFVLIIALSSAGDPRHSSITEFVFGLLFAGVGVFFILQRGFWWVPPWGFSAKWYSPEENPGFFWFSIGVSLAAGAALFSVGCLRLFDSSVPGLFALFELLREWKHR